MTSASRIAIDRQLFDGPTVIGMEASWDEIVRRDLDTWEDEQYGWIRDVIAIDYDQREGIVKFTTCRTIEDPSRGVVEIPRSALERIWIV